MKKSMSVLLLALCPGLALGQDLPGCALTGSQTVMIGGKPALRLSDVVMCPPDTYEIISSVTLDGQPMVHFKPVHFGKTRCAVMGDTPTVTAEGKTVATQGATHCLSN